MVASFAKENRLATLVGTRTAGEVLGDGKATRDLSPLDRCCFTVHFGSGPFSPRIKIIAETKWQYSTSHVTDAKAVPDLIAIFKRPHSDLITGRVQIALKIIQQQSHDAQLRQTIEDALGEP